MESQDEWKVVSKKTRPVKPRTDEPPKFSSLSNISASRYQNRKPYEPKTFPKRSEHQSFSTGYKGSKVSNHKVHDFNIPQFMSPEEEAKFTSLQKEIPHLMMPGHIRKIQRKINIDDLSERLLSDEWIEYQRKGWVYEKVIKPDETGNIPDTDEYDILPLGNKWGDVVLFKKV